MKNLSFFSSQSRQPSLAKSIVSSVLISGIPVVLSMGLASAADILKDGTNTDLTAGGTWIGGTAPASGDTAVWDATSLGAGLTAGTDVSWQGLSVTGALSDIDITGGGKITIGTGGIDMRGSTVDMSIGNNVALGSAQDWNIQTGQALTVSGQVTGSNAVTINGAYDSTTFGSYLTTSAQPVWSGKTLADITAVGGTMNGGFINGSGGPGTAFFLTSGAPRTYQLQIADGGFLKGVQVELSQVGADIHAKANWAKYKNLTGNPLGTDLSDGFGGTVAKAANDDGYGVETTTLETGTNSQGNVLFDRTGGNGAAIGSLNVNAGAVEVNGGGLHFANAGGYFNGSDINVGSKATYSISGAFNAGYNTAFTIDGGTLDLQSDNYINNLTLKNGATVTGTRAMRMGLHSDGVLNVEGTSASTINNTLTLVNGTPGDQVTINVANVDGGAGVDLTMNAAINDFGGSYNGATLIKVGDGTMRLNSNTGFTGDFIINGGTVELNASLNNASEVQINSGATLDVKATNRFLRTSSSAAIIIDGGTLTASGGDHNKFGNMTLKNGALWTTESTAGAYDGENFVIRPGSTITVGGTSSSTMNAKDGVALESGVVTFDVADTGDASGADLNVDTQLENGGGLTKTGAGTMKMTKSNIYTGNTTIEQGTLALGANGAIANSPTIDVQAGAILDSSEVTGGFALGSGQTLMGTGTIVGPIEAALGSTIAPGASPGTLTFTDDLTVAGGATMIIELDGTGAGLFDVVDGDATNASNTLTIEGGTLDLVVGYAAAEGDSFVVFENWTIDGAGFDTINGTDLGGGLFIDTANLYTTGTLNVVTIPEPSSAALLALGGLALTLRRRK